MTAPVAERTRGALALAVVSGALVATQQRLNGDLGKSLHDPLLAATFSFSSGLVVALVVLAVRRSARAALPRLRTVPWWTRLGGFGGASLVASGAFLAPRIGVALLTVGLVAGQTVGGLLSDRFGLGPGRPRPATRTRVAGAALALVAVAIAVSGGIDDVRPVLLAAVVLSGSLVAVQQALNGRVRLSTRDVPVTTVNNFLGGTLALSVVLAAHALVAPTRAVTWPGPDRFWLYLGGSLGVVFVGIASAVVRRVGVLRLGLAVTAGQLLGAVLLDLGRGVAVGTLVGVALTMVAVALSGKERT